MERYCICLYLVKLQPCSLVCSGRPALGQNILIIIKYLFIVIIIITIIITIIIKSGLGWDAYINMISKKISKGIFYCDVFH